MTKHLPALFLTAFFLLSVILGALLDRLHADLAKDKDNELKTVKMRLEMLNNGKIHSYPLDGVNYRLVEDEK